MDPCTDSTIPNAPRAKCISDVTEINQFLQFIKENNIEKVVELLNKGIDVNVMDIYTGLTGLHLAVKYGYKKIFDLLINRNAKIDIRDDVGETPSDLAYDFKREDMAKTLEDMQIKKAGTTNLMLKSMRNIGNPCI